jgi:hypothetical protein
MKTFAAALLLALCAPTFATSPQDSPEPWGPRKGCGECYCYRVLGAKGYQYYLDEYGTQSKVFYTSDECMESRGANPQCTPSPRFWDCRG